MVKLGLAQGNMTHERGGTQSVPEEVPAMPLTEEALASGISYAGSECDPSGNAAIQGRTSSTRAAEHNIISSSDAIDDPDHRGFWVTLALWNKWRHETYRPTDGWGKRNSCNQHWLTDRLTDGGRKECKRERKNWVGREREIGPCTAHEPPPGQRQAKLCEAQQFWED